MKISTKYITRAGIIAAIYCAITILISPFAFGPIQIRISEAMTILPAIFPSAIPGLFVGCLLSNTLGMTMGLTGLPDVIFGSLATLIAAWLSYLLRSKTYLAPLPPIIVNGVVIGYLLYYMFNYPLIETMLTVAAGQAIACYAIGLPLLLILKKRMKNIPK